MLTIRQQQQETIQAYTKRFNKEATEVPSLGDREHIQAYKHGLRSLSLTKVLATKWLHSVDDLLDVFHEFIKVKISVQNKWDHLENQLRNCKGKLPFRVESSRPQCKIGYHTHPLDHTHNRGQEVTRTSVITIPCSNSLG